MPKWRVYVSYWCGYTGDRDWLERTHNALAAQGWSDIRFGNQHTPDYVPFSNNIDADEIQFITQVQLDREAVEQVLQEVGIQHTAYVTIEEVKTE